MEFRLGEFEVLGLSHHLAYQLALLARRRAARAARSAPSDARPEMLDELVGRIFAGSRGPATRPGPERAPCMLEACGAGHPEHEWLAETYAALQDARPLGVVLHACVAKLGPDAPFIVVATARGVRGEVRRGDVVQGGFVLKRTPESGLQLLPRIFRVSCANGAITAAGVGEAQAIEPRDLRPGIAEMLSHRKLEVEVARLALAAATTVEDPLDVLNRARAVSLREEVEREFARGRDRSHWGLINAVTATARSTSDWQRRLEQEGDAGAILALLEHGPDSRGRGEALQAPRAEERFAVHA